MLGLAERLAELRYDRQPAFGKCRVEPVPALGVVEVARYSRRNDRRASVATAQSCSCCLRAWNSACKYQDVVQLRDVAAKGSATTGLAREKLLQKEIDRGEAPMSRSRR
jgi:hypothetical protein